MHRIRLANIASSIACTIFLSGCRKKVSEKKNSEKIDFGTIENSIYKNKYFGLTVTIPSDWSIQNQESRQRMMETGAKIFAGEDQNLKAIVEASQLQTVNLLTVTKYPIGAPVTFNPYIVCVAERVDNMPEIKSGKDYLFNAIKFLESGQMAYSFPRETFTEKLGDKELDVQYAELTTAGVKVQQKFYIVIMKGYALVFIESFTNAEEEESSLDNILRSVAFK
jgi:hypothetical protein